MNINIRMSIKFFFAVSATASLFVARDLNLLAPVFLAFLAISLLISQPVNLHIVSKLFKGFVYIFTFTFIAHFYFQQNGLETALFYTLRIAGLLLINSIVALSIGIDDFSNSLTRCFSKIKNNNTAKKIVLISRLSMNFVPLLKEEAQRIYMAQKCRGVDFSCANLRAKANNYLSLFIPVLVSCIKKADDISLAMKARQFNGYLVKIDSVDNNYKKGIEK